MARLIPVTLRSVVAVDRQEGTSHTTIHVSPPAQLCVNTTKVSNQQCYNTILGSTLWWNLPTSLQAAPSSPALLNHLLLSIPPTAAQHKRKATMAILPLPPLCSGFVQRHRPFPVQRGLWKLTQELQSAPQHLVPTHHLDNLALHQQVGNKHGDQEATEAPQAL